MECIDGMMNDGMVMMDVAVGAAFEFALDI